MYIYYRWNDDLLATHIILNQRVQHFRFSLLTIQWLIFIVVNPSPVYILWNTIGRILCFILFDLKYVLLLRSWLIVLFLDLLIHHKVSREFEIRIKLGLLPSARPASTSWVESLKLRVGSGLSETRSNQGLVSRSRSGCQCFLNKT